LFLVFLVVGTMLWGYYQHTPLPIPIPEVKPGSGISANDYIFPIFILTGVPHVLKGFLIVAILSAAMSSVSSALTSLASVSTMDFVKPLVRQARAESYFLTFSKVSTVAWAALLILVAYLSREVAYVLNAAFSLRGLTSGALLGGLLLVLMWRKGRALPVMIGSITSVAIMVFLSRLEWTQTNASGELAKVKLAWPWFTLIGTTITLTVAWIVRLLSPIRDSRDTAEPTIAH
jgi:solute:Na+ symporter, SSS family